MRKEPVMIIFTPETLVPTAYSTVEILPGGAARVMKKDSLVPDINSYAEVKGISFHDGAIDVDVRGGIADGAHADARGFIGIVFRANAAGSEFEGFYIRPTNGRDCVDPVRRAHGCQYFSFPGYTFSYFREFGIPDYEAPADTVALNEWSHIRAEIKGAEARFFVDGVNILTVNGLKHGAGARGSVGLYVDNGTDGLFKDLEIRCDD